MKKIRIGRTVYDVSDLPAFAVWTARPDRLGSGLRQVQIRQDDIPNEVFAALLALLRSPDPDGFVRRMDLALVYELMRVMDYFGMYGSDTRQARHALYGRHRHHVEGGKTRIHEVYDTISPGFQQRIQEQDARGNRQPIRRMVQQQFVPRLHRRLALEHAARFVPPDQFVPRVARREPQVFGFYFRDEVLQRMLRERDTRTVHTRSFYDRLFVAYGVVDPNGEYRVMENVYLVPRGVSIHEAALAFTDGVLVLDDVHDITRLLQ